MAISRLLSRSSADFPRRIVCLSDETTETLYLLGEQERIVGVSGFSVRPPEVRSKPRVSTFQDADYKAILRLKPDLVLAFSDVQAEIARQLILCGVPVMCFNQRSIREILEMILAVSRLVGREAQGEALVNELATGLEQIAESASRFPYRPRIFFEEWYDPLISGIAWVEELMEIAGGEVLFPELRECGKSQDRVVAPSEVVARNPQVIVASWCGMKVKRQTIVARAGWETTDAVRNGHVYEIPSSCILQPGTAAFTEGVQRLHAILARVSGVEPACVMGRQSMPAVPLE